MIFFGFPLFVFRTSDYFFHTSHQEFDVIVHNVNLTFGFLSRTLLLRPQFHPFPVVSFTLYPSLTPQHQLVQSASLCRRILSKLSLTATSSLFYLWLQFKQLQPPFSVSIISASRRSVPLCRECRTAVLHDITVLSKNRVYFTASILKVQWLAHTLLSFSISFSFLIETDPSASSLSLFMLLI